MLSENTEKKKTGGRPENPTLAAAFLDVVEFFECSDYDQVTVQRLVNVMQGSLGGADATLQPYTAKYLKKKLKEHFGEDIVFTDPGRGKAHVSLRKNASTILHDFFV